MTRARWGATRMATEDQLAEVQRCEAGFAWFEKTLRALDDSALNHTIYRKNKEFAIVRLQSLKHDVLFLYHALGIRDEHP